MAKDKTLTVRFDEEDFAELEQKAKAANLPIAEYIRQLVYHTELSIKTVKKKTR